jgi:hypothetical protein
VSFSLTTACHRLSSHFIFYVLVDFLFPPLLSCPPSGACDGNPTTAGDRLSPNSVSPISVMVFGSPNPALTSGILQGIEVMIGRRNSVNAPAPQPITDKTIRLSVGSGRIKSNNKATTSQYAAMTSGFEFVVYGGKRTRGGCRRSSRSPTLTLTLHSNSSAKCPSVAALRKFTLIAPRFASIGHRCRPQRI